MSSRPLSPIDAAWYRMDRPYNPAVITGLLRLDGPVDRDTVLRIFEKRLLPFERFRYRVVERGWPWALPYWEPDPHFDLRAHVHERGLSESGRDALLTLVGDLASEPLVPDRPPWNAFVVDEGGMGTSLVVRFHHCMADGTGTIALADHLLDPTGTDAPAGASEPRPSTLPPSASVAGRATRALGTGLRSGLEHLGSPLESLRQCPSLAEALGTAVKDVLQPPDPPSPLRGALTGRQRLAYTEPLPLAAIKAVGAPVDATVNDVLLAALTGAVRHYLLDRAPGGALPPLRAIVPVDQRPAERALELGNAFGLTFLSLPVDERSPGARLRATKRNMDALKRSSEAPVFLNILRLFGQLPRVAEDAAASLFAGKASMVMTNVAGPADRRTLGGHPVDDIVFWVPHPVSLGIGMSILSYAGRVTVGVMTDAGVVSTPSTLTDRFRAEFEALQSCVRDGIGAAQSSANR